MDFTLQIFKFYDLSSPISVFKIVRNIKKFSTKNLEQYDISNINKEPNFIDYPKPISFEYNEQNFYWKNEKLNILGKIYGYGALSLNTEIKLKINDIKEINQYINNNKPLKIIESHLDSIYQKINKQFNEDNKSFYPETDINHLYPVYCISSTGLKDVKKLVMNNKQEITALLSGIHENNNTFSQDQIKNILNNQIIRFYEKDYNIIHWYGSLIVDNDASYSDILFTIELANIQFLKLQAYDKFLDNYLENYLYSIKNTLTKKLPYLILGVRKIMKEITQLRIEFDIITEIMENFEKLYGNWYLAKIYYLTGKAFEIPRWKKMVSSKIETIDELYHMLQEESNNTKMLTLSFLTFLLFILWFVTG
ncbi:MAG: hypothetical protein ACOC4G_03455 [Bacillota bacterium]